MDCYGNESSEGEVLFRIDDLLDFSNEEIGGPIGSSDENDEAEAEERNSDDSSVTETEAAATCEVASRPTPNVVEADAGLVPAELCVPTDALEELEWLSTFVDDTFEPSAVEFEPVAAVAVASAAQQKASRPVEVTKTWLLGRARSKRRPSRSLSVSSSQSTVFVNAFLGRAEAEASVCSRPPQPPPVAKKAKKVCSRSLEDGSPVNRRCSHCLVQKTPQWRTGPLGPKTLCNACGVRYKSGRLLPEYRPALSPTFSSDIHSNCHRKVIEIRRQKETQPQMVA